MRRNVAGQFIGCQLNAKADGSEVTTGTTTVYVTGEAGTQAAGSVGSGACTHEGHGYWTYAPAQAETNYTQVAFTFVNTNAITATVQLYPIAYGASGQMTAVELAADQAVNTTKIGGTTQTARDIGASVLLSSGSGAGQLDFTSGIVKSNLTQILGTLLTETAGQIAAAFKQFFDIASPTSTMNTITTVTTTTTATNLTNAPANGDFTATMKTSLNAATPASVTGAVGSVTGNVGGNVTGSIGSLATQAKADVNAEVVDALNVDNYAEPGQEAPGSSVPLTKKIGYLYKAFRNKVTQGSGGTLEIYNSGGTVVDQKATASDDGTTYTRGEIGTGP